MSNTKGTMIGAVILLVGLFLLMVAFIVYAIPRIPETLAHIVSGFLALSLVAEIAVVGLLMFIVGGIVYIIFDASFDSDAESEGF